MPLTKKNGARSRKPAPKSKKSYTLSPESVAFLEALRKERRDLSVSAILDGILRSLIRARKKAALDRAITGYYDSIPAEERDEPNAWGEFALQNFPREDA